MHILEKILFKVVCVVLFLDVTRSYVITTPRKWVSGETAQVCITTTKQQTPIDSILLSLTSENNKVIDKKDLTIPADEGTICNKVTVPLLNSSKAVLELKGSLDAEKLSYSKDIIIVTPQSSSKTYVQTDKYLYKPSQLVNIRVLSIVGPSLNVFFGKFPEIWIENPNKARLSQWLDVDTSDGLIHLSFQLSEEPTPGEYLVRVRDVFDGISDTRFKIEDYVLPRYEVTIKPPGFVLSSDKEAAYEICAKYTFGQPLKGEVLFKIENDAYGRRRQSLEMAKNISGCALFVVSLDSLTSSYAYSLKASAEVIEEGTETKLAADPVTTSISTNAINFNDISMQQYAKPDLPFLAEIKASFPDGSPAGGEPMNVCAGNDVCKNYTTNNRGVLKLAIPPHLAAKTIKIKSSGFPRIENPDAETHTRPLLYESSTTINLNEYNSPSGSSLIIGLTQRTIQCLPNVENIAFDLPVWFSSKGQSSAPVSVQVISRGQILFADTKAQSFEGSGHFAISPELYLEPSRVSTSPDSFLGSFSVPIVLPKTASPKIKILVWYARNDGEVVSDFREIDISECLLNNVGMKWASEMAYPGDMTTLSLSAKPFSLCSLGVVDKSVALLQPEDNDVTVSRLLKHSDEFVIHSNEANQIDDTEYCKKKIPPKTTTTPSPDLTTIPFRFRPYHEEIYYTTKGKDSIHNFNEAGVHVMSNKKVEFRECEEKRRPIYAPYRPLNFNVRFRATTTTSISFTSTTTMTSSIEGIEEKSDSPKEQSQRVFFPETWLWDLVLLSSTGVHTQSLSLPDTVTEWVGKAVCAHPTEGVGVSSSSSIITFRDFFIDLTLPPTAKRGEVFALKISIFNYLNEPLPVHLILEPSNEYEILSDPSYSGSTPGEHKDCIDSQDKVVHSIPIRPTEVGDVNITVQAYVDINSISNCSIGTLQERRDYVIKPIRVDFEGFPKEETFTDYVCVSETAQNIEDKEKSVSWSLVPPKDIVQNSTRGFLSVVGDLMGPTMENLGHLVRMPSGCGEQNMIGFAPNIFVLQYLEASSEGSQEVKDDAVKYMEAGYKRELNYRHKDGSYSAFGERDASGSTWLTAFVLKCYSQARPYIFIDPEEITKSSDWLKSHQAPDGCFSSVGKVLHKEMKGGISGSDSGKVLTSFVLIALLESGLPPSSRVVADSLSCIKNDPNKSPYTLALKAYALTLAKDASAQQALKELLTHVSEQSGIVTWNTKMGESQSLEAMGYAVLAFIEAGDSQSATKFVKTMNTKRNGQGGFISTQDTIVALQALAAFESALSGETDVAVIMEMVDPQGVTKASSLAVDHTNRLLLQKTSINSFPTTINLDVFGNGCALVQAVMRYNVPKPEASEAFQMSVSASTVPDKGCKTKSIGVCASYLLPDLASNMAIVEVDVMTGYIPDKASLKRAVRGLVKRYEVDGSKVLFYLDELSSQETCLQFTVLREFEVEDAKDGTVALYDYYAPEFAISESYRLPPTDECHKTSLEPPPLINA